VSRGLLYRLLIVAGVICLTGCAAKEVIPVRMVQPGDEGLSCAALKEQITANRVAAADFVRKDKQVEQQNVAKNIGGAIPVLGLFLVSSTDLSNEEQVKGRALVDRDEHLTFLAKQKGCTE